MRIDLTEATRLFPDLVNRVSDHGETFELVQGNHVVARLGPARPASHVQVRHLRSVFGELPGLEEDVEAFVRDVESARRLLPPEINSYG